MPSKAAVCRAQLGRGRAGREGQLCPCSSRTCTPATRGPPSDGKWWTGASHYMQTTRPSSRRWQLNLGLTTDSALRPGSCSPWVVPPETAASLSRACPGLRLILGPAPDGVWWTHCPSWLPQVCHRRPHELDGVRVTWEESSRQGTGHLELRGP